MVTIAGHSEIIVDILNAGFQFKGCRPNTNNPKLEGELYFGCELTSPCQEVVRRVAFSSEPFIMQLPPDCGSHFVRYRGIIQLMKISSAGFEFGPAAHIQYDFIFEGGVAEKPVRFKSHYGNHPNHLTAVGATGTLTAVPGTVLRSWFNDFKKWVEELSKLSFDQSSTFDMNKSVEKTLFNARGTCEEQDRVLEAQLSVKLAGNAFAKGIFGMYVSGVLLPQARIDEAYVYFKATSGASVTLSLDADAFFESSHQKNVLNIPLTPFEIPGIGTFGPVFEVDVGYQSDVSIHAGFSSTINVNIPPLDFAFGKLADGSKQQNAPSTTTQGTDDQSSAQPIQPSFQADFDASGYIRAFVIPRVIMDVNLLSGALDGRIGLEANVGPTAALTMSASAGTGQAGSVQGPCLNVDIDADVALIANAEALWGVTSASFTKDLYVLNKSIFQRCLGSGGSVLQPGRPGDGSGGNKAISRRRRRSKRSQSNMVGVGTLGLPSTPYVATNTSNVSIKRRQSDQPIFDFVTDLCPAEPVSGCPAAANAILLPGGSTSRQLTTTGQKTYASCSSLFYQGAPPVLAATNEFNLNAAPKLFELCIGRGDFKYPLLFSGGSKINVFSAGGGDRRVAPPSDREGGYFGQVNVVPKCDQPSQNDYTASVAQTTEPNIQRGHILANRDATGLVADEAQRTIAQRDTNTVANLVPQFSNFNNGDWKALENFIQNLFGLPLQGRSDIDFNDAIETFVRSKFKSLKVFKVAGSAQPETVQAVSGRLTTALPGSPVLATKYNRLVDKAVAIPKFMWMAVCVVFEDIATGATFTESAAFIGLNAPIQQSGARAGCSCLLNPRPVSEVASKVKFTSIFGADGCSKDVVGANLMTMMNTFGLIKNPAEGTCNRLGLTCP
ncbi:hypothetical protein HK102_010849 [Quaeritorhiza haematococci]|nr:hypothetical protein HK102_010849 [Quaeritorhiza haematococci]